MNCTAPQLLSSLTAPRRMSFRKELHIGNTLEVQIIRYHTVGVNILRNFKKEDHHHYHSFFLQMSFISTSSQHIKKSDLRNYR